MIKYFFKLAFRNIRKYKVNTFISVLGLTVGLTSFILITSFVSHELSFNKNNEHFDRIFVANLDLQAGDGPISTTYMPYPLLEGLVEDFPEVKNGVRFMRAWIQVTNDNVSFFEDNGYYTDNSLFDIFTVNFLSGDKKNALSEPNTIVLTKSYAEKYFGDENPIGKDLLLDNVFLVKVTAIIDDLPVNTDLKYDFFISIPTLFALDSHQEYMQNYDDWSFKMFFLLDNNCDYEKLNEKIVGYLDSHVEEMEVKLNLTSLSDYHLDSDNSNIVNILIIYGVVAIFILIIACINFINLSVANAANRVKETSIRRIVGSKKSSLILQQIGESVLLSFISFDLAYLLAERLLPQFNLILETEIPSRVILNFTFIISMLAIAVLLGLVTGIFPAIKTSRIQPLKAISGREPKISKASIAKKGLVVFQYAVSIVLIIASIVLSQQFNYIKNKDLGFDGENVLTCWIRKLDNSDNTELKPFRDVLLNQSGVQNVSLHLTLPFVSNSNTFMKKETAPKEDEILVNNNSVDKFFLETYNIDLVLKKEFSIHSEGDIGFCYINEAAVVKMDFENPLGEILVVGDNKYEIVGICSNYHIQNLQKAIEPQVIILKGKTDIATYNQFCWMSIQCDKDHIDDIKEIANIKLKEFIPDIPYSFFRLGNSELKVNTLNSVQGIEKSFGFFTLIAVIIACMGIFGLVALSVKHKTKEIGIRKSLGSSVFEIYKLIAQEYLFLAVLGNVFAWFPAWYIINKILQDFAYRVDIGLWVFVLGFISSILLTIITIAFHTIKAARTNPVEALRYE